MNKEEIEYIIKTDRNTGEIMFSRGNYSFKQWGVRHEIIDLIEQLQQENKQLQEDYAKIVQNNCYTLELEKRIDEAIKILNAMKHIDNLLKMGGTGKTNIDKLLKILKGE